MGVQLNHTIVWCSDKQKSTRFLMDILDLPSSSSKTWLPEFSTARLVGVSCIDMPAAVSVSQQPGAHVGRGDVQRFQRSTHAWAQCFVLHRLANQCCEEEPVCR